MDGDLVQPQYGLRRLAIETIDDALEHEMLRNAVCLLEDLQEASGKILRRDVGKEAEPAEIDAEHRNLAIAHLASGAENRPIAAEDEGDIGARMLGEVELLPQIDEQHLDLLLE